MDLTRILPRELVNTHIVFKAPSGDLQSGVLRGVQKGKVNDAVVYLVGIELDRPREGGSTRDGYFLGHQVVDCEPGKGFVCEEKALQGKIKRARGSRGEFWICESCKHTNQCLAVSSYAEYIALSYGQAKDLVQCGECKGVRMWYCPHESCVGNGPLEIADITKDAIYETLTCPDCRQPPLAYWPCPICDTVVSTEYCEKCDPDQQGNAPSRDAMLLLQQLKSYRWSTNPSGSESAPTSSSKRRLRSHKSSSRRSRSRGRSHSPRSESDEDPRVLATQVADELMKPAFQLQYRYHDKEKALADAGFDPDSVPRSSSRSKSPSLAAPLSSAVSPRPAPVATLATPLRATSPDMSPLRSARPESPDEKRVRAKALLAQSVEQFKAAARTVQQNFEVLQATEDEALATEAAQIAHQLSAVERETAAKLSAGRGATSSPRALLPSENATIRITDRRRMSSGHEENPIPVERSAAPKPAIGEAKSSDDEPQPHFTPRLGFHHLADEYKGDEHVDAAINLLKKKYSGWRAMLDDGNSFYRSVFIAFLESCIQASDGDAVLKLCDNLETIAGTESIREWLVAGFAKPLLRLSGKLSDASLEALDAFLAENATFDEDIVRAMRKKTAKYIAENAEAVEKDDMTLKEELLSASGVEHADLSEFLKRHVVALNQPTTSVMERACVEAFGWTVRIVDFSGTKILVRTINGNLSGDEGDDEAARKGKPLNGTLLMSAGQTGAQFDVLVPKFTGDVLPTYKSKSSGIHRGTIPDKYKASSKSR